MHAFTSVGHVQTERVRRARARAGPPDPLALCSEDRDTGQAIP